VEEERKGRERETGRKGVTERRDERGNNNNSNSRSK
jgi:hypothetical protein